MKSGKYIPDGSGVVQGDSKAIPDAGSHTGMNGDSYGADLGQDATNGKGSITGSTKSDPMMDDCNHKPTTL